MKITVVASELLGRVGTGGAGTADSLLAVALGRHGHDVDLLIASGREIGALNERWAGIYDSAGVTVRVLEGRRGIRPPYLAPTLEVFHALRDAPPDVAIVNDWRGLGYAAQRTRQLGAAFAETAFVMHCHGPGRVLAEFAQKVPDTASRFGEGVTERGSLELADAVVSPSAWLLGWMREHGWPVPDTARVIPYVRQSAALDEDPEVAPGAPRIERLAFFGQLREGKGIRIFVNALAELEPELLEGVELAFLGSARSPWTGDRILSALAPAVKERVAGISFETNLDRDAALERLLQSGTLAVMPSLLDNSPNAVSECIEQGIPFVSTRTGGIPELVAEEDRARVLCEPNAGDLAAALRRALQSTAGFEPAHPAHDPRASLEAWLEVLTSVAPPPLRAGRRATHIAVVAGGEESARRARRLAEAAPSVEVEVVTAVSRWDGLARTAADWVIFLDDEDDPDDSFLETLVAAQAASGADLVTAAVRPAEQPDGIQLFLGDPGALGLVENQYGVVGLLRSSLAVAGPLQAGAIDPDWPLFARIALAGGRVVSLPEPLATHSGRPGRAADVPGEGLAVLSAFEEDHSRELRDLPELAATLGASLSQPTATIPDRAPPRQALTARFFTVLRTEGFGGVVRRARTRLD
jgi:glycosyltransferase involved in cell wall biosynthesis